MPRVEGLTIEKSPRNRADQDAPWLKSLKNEALLHEVALEELRRDLVSDESTKTVYLQAKDIWQDSQGALEWLAKPHPELNDERPATLLKNPEGRERVRNLLGAIEYGFPV